MATYQVINITLPEVELTKIEPYITNSRQTNSSHIVFTTPIPKSTIPYILDEIKEYDLRTGLTISNMIGYNDMSFGTIDKSATIKIPCIVDGKLTSKDIPVMDRFGMNTAIFRGIFRGICSVDVVLTIEVLDGTREVISLFVKHITPGNESLRFMGNEVFPDYLSGIENIPNEEFTNFMNNY